MLSEIRLFDIQRKKKVVHGGYIEEVNVIDAGWTKEKPSEDGITGTYVKKYIEISDEDVRLLKEGKLTIWRDGDPRILNKEVKIEFRYW